MNPDQNNQLNLPRRDFIKKAGLGALAFSFPFPNLPDSLKELPMGVVVHSYSSRWRSGTKSVAYPGFSDALELIRHCNDIGAGGVQVGVSGWTEDFSKKVRDEREKIGLYLEGSISLPKEQSAIEKFEKEVIAAKEAGATVLRTACLSGRRYENFKTASEYLAFKQQAIESIERAEPIVRKYQMKLAIENHKDWTALELVDILEKLGSEWVGATLDFGNNISLLEDPMEVIRTLAPVSFSTHVKDMGVKEYEDGFLLSEVPLGEGIIDLKEAVSLCRKFNPEIQFSLEMITRDPLKIPCLEEDYWGTFGEMSASQLAKTLKMVRDKETAGELPTLTDLSEEQKLANEETNIRECLNFSHSVLKIG